MMDYVVVRNTNLEIIGIIDTAKSVIWHKVYYGVGDFEIYAQATTQHIDLLKRGNYITRIDDDEVGIIERIDITQDAQNGLTIAASGRFAKSLLDRRIIYTLYGKLNNPTILRGNVESAARALVVNNAISCSFNTKRNMAILQLGSHSGSTKIIVDEAGMATQKQVTNDNLLTYTDALLQEYEMSAKIILSADETKLQYRCFEGIDRSMNNASGIDSVIFSSDFDNLTDSEYSTDDKSYKNMALIGGEGEGIERFYSTIEDTRTGVERREIFINASSISKKYKDNNDQEQTYTDAEYKAMLDSRGKLELAQRIQIVSLNGTINTLFGNWILNIDYSLGDIVTIQNNEIGVYADVRITETTEVQDDNGYSVSLNYQ